MPRFQTAGLIGYIHPPSTGTRDFVFCILLNADYDIKLNSGNGVNSTQISPEDCRMQLEQTRPLTWNLQDQLRD